MDIYRKLVTGAALGTAPLFVKLHEIVPRQHLLVPSLPVPRSSAVTAPHGSNPALPNRQFTAAECTCPPKNTW